MLYKAKSLTMPSIEQLARKEVMAVHIKEFIKPELEAELAEKILLQGYHGYTNAPSIGRIGMAFYETEGDVNRSSISKCQKTAEVCKFGSGRWHRPNLMQCVRPATALIRATWVKRKFT